ncbi:MAG TPA: DUF378 domain-containing protein [Candidatus Paceibacterota bacterium]
MVAFILLVVGGLNWGLSAFGWNVVNMVVGTWPMLENLIYVLVGLSAVYELVAHKKSCKECAPAGM